MLSARRRRGGHIGLIVTALASYLHMNAPD
jgi:hypothetical protein